MSAARRAHPVRAVDPGRFRPHVIEALQRALLYRLPRPIGFPGGQPAPTVPPGTGRRENEPLRQSLDYERKAMRLKPMLLLLCGAVFSFSQVAAACADPGSRIRFDNDRISEVFRYATKNSPSFVDLIATLETLDRLVYVEEGHCGHSEERACLHLLRSPDSRVLVIRIDPRQPIRAVALQLAHELYHALEVAREPDVVD